MADSFMSRKFICLRLPLNLILANEIQNQLWYSELVTVDLLDRL